MAFVPRVHNRAAPKANVQEFVRTAKLEQAKHREAILNMKPAIDNKWGGVRNGVRETKRPMYPVAPKTTTRTCSGGRLRKSCRRGIAAVNRCHQNYGPGTWAKLVSACIRE